jgi:hypothetical protein
MLKSQVKFSVLENLGIEMDNNAAWETSTENIKI